MFPPSFAFLKKFNAILKYYFDGMFMNFFFVDIIAFISKCLILLRKWPNIGITIVIFSIRHKIELKSFIFADFLQMKYFTCIFHALNLCNGNCTISDLVSNYHPKLILASSVAPSALFLSSAIKFCLGTNVSNHALCATACIMLYGSANIFCRLSPLSTPNVMILPIKTSALQYSPFIISTLISLIERTGCYLVIWYVLVFYEHNMMLILLASNLYMPSYHLLNL